MTWLWIGVAMLVVPPIMVSAFLLLVWKWFLRPTCELLMVVKEAADGVERVARSAQPKWWKRGF